MNSSHRRLSVSVRYATLSLSLSVITECVNAPVLDKYIFMFIYHIIWQHKQTTQEQAKYDK